MTSPALSRGIRIVERLGIALVYPIANRPELRSLWSELYPKTKMEWSWNADADPRVAEVWHLRERLARSHDVAYAKWFRGRATLFSLPVFHAMLGRIAAAGDPLSGLPPAAHDILALLRERSPLSTKELRALADLRGKEHEATFTQAMKALWARLLVVGTGEVEDGAFPSLAVGATELLFEDLWSARRRVPVDTSRRLGAVFEGAPAYERELGRTIDDLASGKTQRPLRAHAESATRERLRDDSDTPRARRRAVVGPDAHPPFNEPTAREVYGRDHRRTTSPRGRSRP